MSAADPTDRLLETARTLAARGDGDGARVLLQRLLAARQDHVPALHLLGLILAERAQHAAAVAALERAARISPSPALLGDLGVEYGQLGDAERALECLRQAVAGNPDDAQLQYNLGNALLAAGRAGEAAASFRRATELRPDHVEALNNLGNALRALGRPEAALEAYRRGLALRPDGPVLQQNLAETLAGLRPEAGVSEAAVGDLLRAGDVTAAAAMCHAVLQRNPDTIDAAYLLGACRNMQGAPATAIDLLRDVLARAPDHAGALCELGLACLNTGEPARALAALDRAVALEPGFVAAHINRAETLDRMGRREDAVRCYGQVLALQPDSVLALSNRGNLLCGLGRASEALADQDRAVALQPRRADSHFNRGNALQALARHEEAVAAYDTALALRPDDAQALNNRGVSLRRMGRHAAAAASFRDALRASPGFAMALTNMAIELEEAGETSAARDLHQRAVTADPGLFQARCGLVSSTMPMVRDAADRLEPMRAAYGTALEDFFSWARAYGHGINAVGEAYAFPLAYHDRNNRDLLARHGRLCAAAMAEWLHAAGLEGPAVPASPGAGRVVVGIVMSQFWNHSVWLAIVKGWVAHLDRARFAVHLFHTGDANDAETAWARAHADSFIQAAPGAPMSLADWVGAIRDRAPDVLIYPEFGMDHPTMRLASLRLAPVQAASWGHPETTGLPTIDHYISADAFEPSDAADCYTEALLRLPRLGCAYERLPVVASPFDLAEHGIPEDRPLLVCPGTPFKYPPENDALFIEIARLVPEARMLFFTLPRSPGLSQRVAARLAASFRAAGMDFARHGQLLPWLGRPQFYHLLARADAMLDTVGFSGFNTVMQALECGLPVVTMEGRFLRGRLGSGILRTMGVDELVATDSAGYLDIAERLVTDRDFNAAMRARIAERREALFDDVATVRALEDFLERAVRRPGRQPG